MKNYLLLFFSVCTETGKNLAFDFFGKRKLSGEADLHLFNMISYIGATLVLLCTVGNFGISAYTLLTAVGFAVVTLLSQLFYIKALAVGPMSYTTFFSCCGFLVSTLFGVLYYHETIGLHQIICLPLLVLALALTMDLQNGNYTKKWLFYALASLFFTGLIGVFQKVHQESAHSGEIGMFLVIAFLIMTLTSALIFLFARRGAPSVTMKAISFQGMLGLLAGVALGIVHRLNLYLSGAMDSILFFPLANGGLILLSTIASAVFFHEHIRAKQWIGLLLGIAIICVMGI